MSSDVDYKEALKAIFILAIAVSILGWILLFLFPIGAFFVWGVGGLLFIGSLAILAGLWMIGLVRS